MDLLNMVKCERRIYTYEYQTHSHPYGQLILPLQGELNIKANLFDLKVDDKHLFFLPPDVVHTFSSQNKNEFLVLDIPLKIFYGFGVKTCHSELCYVFDERWKAIRFLILQEASNRYSNNSSMLDLIRYASNLLFQKNTPQSIQYIHDNYNKQLKVESLALIEHFNVSYYCEWFYNQTGMTPNAYIQKIRLEKAKELLEGSNLTVLEIAQLVGYSHQSSLTRLFQKIERLNPACYRKMRKKDKIT